MLSSEVMLFAVLFVAVATDVKTGKIKNWLTLPALACGPIVHLLQGGKNEAVLSLAGLGAMLVVAALLLSFRLVGGGDAKLLVAVGSLAGIALVTNTLLYMAIAGGLMALITLILQRRTSAVAGQLARTAFLKLRLGVSIPWALPNRTKLPYSIAIATGTIVAVFMQP